MIFTSLSIVGISSVVALSKKNKTKRFLNKGLDGVLAMRTLYHLLKSCWQLIAALKETFRLLQDGYFGLLGLSQE